jgi:hypothetical protein
VCGSRLCGAGDLAEWHDYGPDWASFFREGLDSDSARNLSARSSCVRITASKVAE